MKNLVFSVVEKLKTEGKSISFAESLTGGLLSDTIVSVPGASEVFGYGFVTYTDEAKCSMLGVSETCLSEYKAVSFECALEMAEGAYKKSKADIAVSVTGFAGPASENDYEPVGTVFMGLCVNGETEVFRLQFDGSRQEIREKTAEAVFCKLNEIL